MMNVKEYLDEDKIKANFNYYRLNNDGFNVFKSDPEEFIKESIKLVKKQDSLEDLTKIVFIIIEPIEHYYNTNETREDIIKLLETREITELKKVLKEKLEHVKNKTGYMSYPDTFVVGITRFFLKRLDAYSAYDYLEIESNYIDNQIRKKFDKCIKLLIEGLEMNLKGAPVLNEKEKIEIKKKKEFEERMEALSEKEFSKTIKDVIKGKTKGYLARVFEVSIKDSPDYSQELFNKLMDNAIRILKNETKEVKELSHWDRIRIAVTVTKYPIRELKIQSKNFKEFLEILYKTIKTNKNAIGQDKNMYLALKDIHEFIQYPGKQFITEKEFEKKKDKILEKY